MQISKTKIQDSNQILQKSYPKIHTDNESKLSGVSFQFPHARLQWLQKEHGQSTI